MLYLFQRLITSVRKTWEWQSAQSSLYRGCGSVQLVNCLLLCVEYWSADFSVRSPQKKVWNTLTDFFERHKRAALRSATRTKLNKKVISLSCLVLSGQPSCDRWVSELLNTIIRGFFDSTIWKPTLNGDVTQFLFKTRIFFGLSCFGAIFSRMERHAPSSRHFPAFFRRWLKRKPICCLLAISYTSIIFWEPAVCHEIVASFNR